MRDFPIVAVFQGLAGLVGLLALLAQTNGCTPDEPIPNVVAPVAEKESCHVEVRRIGIVIDSLAYKGRRGIYVITDKNTKQTWIGVSGIGISELGKHNDGDDEIKDER